MYDIISQSPNFWAYREVKKVSSGPAFVSQFYSENLLFVKICCVFGLFRLKFGHSERGTKFEKIFHLKFDATE